MEGAPSEEGNQRGRGAARGFAFENGTSEND